MKRIKSLFITLICLLLALPLGGCGESKSFEQQLFAMDTVMTMTAYGKNAETGLQSAAGVITSLEKMLDPEDDDSTVYALNHAKGKSIVTEGQIVEMLHTAQTIYERSGKAFDPAIYPLVKAWGFIDGKYDVPSEEEIAGLLPNIDFSNIEITGFPDSGDYLVTLPSGTMLTFGAIAKGCASNYAVAALRTAGVESAIVSLGGNIQTLGQKPDGSNWNVAIQDPNDTGSYVGILSVGETAVVTSGGYQRYFYGDDNVIYHHILDPDTGYPAESGLLSATVVCSDGMLADALSTTMFILGETRALDYWHTYGGFDMILVTDDGRVVITDGLYDTFATYGDSYTFTFTD
ncbi:MAG: FAD:protein FMN transferase [Clostridia bacterium]|nr:FAD:protein FMN transferase [Clostridia bacterium]